MAPVVKGRNTCIHVLVICVIKFYFQLCNFNLNLLSWTGIWFCIDRLYMTATSLHCEMGRSYLSCLESPSSILPWPVSPLSIMLAL